MDLLAYAADNNSSYTDVRDRAREMKSELDKVKWWVSAAPHLHSKRLHATIAIDNHQQVELFIQNCSNLSSRQKYVKYGKMDLILIDMEKNRIE